MKATTQKPAFLRHSVKETFLFVHRSSEAVAVRRSLREAVTVREAVVGRAVGRFLSFFFLFGERRLSADLRFA